MIRGLYTATSAMLAQSRRMDVITNNLTNTETTGFKQDTMTTRSFRDMMISRIYDPSVFQYSQVGPLNLGIHVDQTFTDFSIGPAEATHQTTDFFLMEGAFFVVDFIPTHLSEDELFDVEPETRFTRAGNFNIDGEGFLVTPGGLHVQGEEGNIHIGTTDFVVSRDGTIFVDGEVVDRLRIVTFENLEVLRKEGNNLFSVFGTWDEDFGEFIPAEEPIELSADETDVRQGFLEASNVDVAREMVRMIETHRAYEINQRMINMFDETLRLSVNEIARF